MTKTNGTAAAIFFSAVKIARRTPNAKSITTPKKIKK